MKPLSIWMPHVVDCKDHLCPFRSAVCCRKDSRVHSLEALGYDAVREASDGEAVRCDYVFFSSFGSRPEIFLRLLPDGSAFGKDIPPGVRVIEVPEVFLEEHGGLPEVMESSPLDLCGKEASGRTVILSGFRWRKDSQDLLGFRKLLRFRLLSLSSGELREVCCTDRETVFDSFCVYFDPEPFEGDLVSVERIGFRLAKESGYDIRSCLLCGKAVLRGAEGCLERPVECRAANSVFLERYPMPSQAGVCGMYVEEFVSKDDILDRFVDLVREIHRRTE